MTKTDWRETAYLKRENWPEAIPVMGPKREYGPYPWGEPHTPEDNYPFTHPDAVSVGDIYMGDVCPECGVPLRYDERVVSERGTAGELYDVSPDENPVACWHLECWITRQVRVARKKNHSLGEFHDE